jgi:histone-lysine N-methyltransferase SETMAR
LEELLEEDSRLTTRELASELSVSPTTISNRLRAIGKVQKVGKWVTHKLSEINMAQRLNTCVFLSSGKKRRVFLWKIVTGDEKWIYFDNQLNSKKWLSPDQAPMFIPKPQVHQKKSMLCVW